MRKKIESKNAELLTEVVIEGMKDNKAEDIVLLDLSEIENAVCKFFVICTGSSSTQIEGIANAVIRKTRADLKERPWNQDGKGNSEWILLDYVDVVIHIFSKELRGYYELEELWADARKTVIETV